MTRPLLLGILLLLPALRAGELRAQDSELYTIDTIHSILDFTGRHRGFGRVRGTFNSYRGVVYLIGGDLTRSSATLVIDAASIDTKADGRDGILREEFFQAGQYPYIRFQSERIERRGEGYLATGSLTIRDVTRTVEFPLEVITEVAVDQFKHRRIALAGSLTIDRNDYGVYYRSNDFWDAVVSEEIEIEFEIGARVYNSLDTVFPWRENSIGTMVLRAYESGGLDAAQAKARAVWAGQSEEHDLRLSQLERVGLHLAQQGHLADAVAVYTLALDLYRDTAEPEGLADVYVGRAEAQLRTGDRSAALESVAAALALDPEHPGARALRHHLSR